MTDDTVKQLPSSFRVITAETQRDRMANEVSAEFAAACEDLTKTCEKMAGYFLIVFDDQGMPTSKLYVGKMLPVPPVMLPSIVKDAATVRIHD